jgi:glycosyltransferase involved in cell wall biosynthesis
LSIQPLITVLLPARNEEADIADCIRAIAVQDHPLRRVQLVVIDAASDDATVSRVREVASERPFAEVLVVNNPDRRTSAGLNIGLAHARGEYVARIDARSRILPSYLSACLNHLRDHREIGVVGGMQIAESRGGGAIEEGIARALRNRWATGLSRYRRVSVSGPSDTVWMGFFRTADLRALGGWDASVALNEDYDLNARYRAGGQLVWFDASLRSGYLPRRTFGELARQHFYFGRVKGMWWVRGQRPAPRQIGLVLAPLAGMVLLRSLVLRFGPWSALLVPSAFAAVDALQREREAASARPRMAAATAIGIISVSWWTGVIAGAAGEIARVRHAHA